MVAGEMEPLRPSWDHSEGRSGREMSGKGGGCQHWVTYRTEVIMVYFSHHRDSKVFWAEGWGDIWILYVWGPGKEEPRNSKDFRLWGFPLAPEQFVACVNHIMSLCHLMGPLASFPCKTDKDKKK